MENHGKPVYKLETDGPARVHMDRCELLTNELLLPLMDMASRKTLSKTDELPCAQMCHYLLDAQVAKPCKDAVLAAVHSGLKGLEGDLRRIFDEVAPHLDSTCGPPSQLHSGAAEWAMLSQREMHTPLEWLEQRDMPRCFAALCSCGCTLEDLIIEFTRLGWVAQDQVFPSTYAFWLRAAAKRVEAQMKASLASLLPSRASFGPTKGFQRIMAKRDDYKDNTRNAYPDARLFEADGGHLYDVGGILDLTRCTIECDTPQDMADVYTTLTKAEWPSGEKVVRSKNGFSSGNKTDNPYRDIKLNVHVPAVAEDTDCPEVLKSVGTLAEVQLILRPYLEAKSHMHELYEVVRGDCFGT
jgi:hypothetical protein